jgi:hypothetical protein
MAGSSWLHLVTSDYWELGLGAGTGSLYARCTSGPATDPPPDKKGVRFRTGLAMSCSFSQNGPHRTLLPARACPRCKRFVPQALGCARCFPPRESYEAWCTSFEPRSAGAWEASGVDGGSPAHGWGPLAQ